MDNHGEFKKMMEQAALIASAANMVRRVLPNLDETTVIIVARMLHESFEKSYASGYAEGAENGARATLRTIRSGLDDGMLDVEKLAVAKVRLDEIDPVESSMRVTLYAEVEKPPSETLPGFDFDTPLTAEDLETFERISADLREAGILPQGFDVTSIHAVVNGGMTELTPEEISERINQLFQ